MKENILRLRSEGKSYNEIKKILGCSKGTIAYHCGKGQKEKTIKRIKKRRENNLLAKVDRFKYRKHSKDLTSKKNVKDRKDVVETIRKYQKRDNNVVDGYVNKDIETTFNWEDVLNKFTENTVCYLSGENINLYENKYQIDHILPSSRGGDNSLENLGITHTTVNKMKGDLTPDELIMWCIKILKYNGYSISK